MKEALELYDLLGEYLPEEVGDDFFKFIHEFIGNIAEDNTGAYADALHLMTDKPLEELNEFSTSFLLELFSKGIIENRIFELREFCRKINYA